jgi:hypothetical protein
MAIGTDSTVIFWGTADALGNTTSAVTDGSFSDGTNDLDQWTNSDDAPLAIFALEFTCATAPDVGSTIDLYGRPMNIGSAGTEDSEVPDANFLHYYMGSFPCNDVTSAQTVTFGPVGLPNVITSQPYEFYIHNNAGQTISAGWELIVTPLTFGPHA